MPIYTYYRAFTPPTTNRNINKHYKYHTLPIPLPDLLLKTLFCFLFLKTYQLSKDFTKIGKSNINFDFICTPTLMPRKALPTWNTFLRRVNVDHTADEIPKHVQTIELTKESPAKYFVKIDPFDLTKDACSKWLEWSIYTLPNGDDIRVLSTIDFDFDTNDDQLDRSIGSSDHRICRTD